MPEVRTLSANAHTEKKVLKQAITNAFQNMLSAESNFDLLVDTILKTYNSELYDTTALRLAEKELGRVETSLSNLISAVENGFYSETSKERLKELESRKAELKELIAAEQHKEVKPLAREQVTEYVTYAISQPSQTLINLLVRKVLIKDNTVDVYLKYTSDSPPDKTKHEHRTIYKDPERNLSERGSLFTEFLYSYETKAKGRKPLGIDIRQGDTKYIQIRIFV